MKLAAVLLLMLALQGCQKRTSYGECIGIEDEQERALRYRASTENLVEGIIFVETGFVPVFVVLDRFYCPVGRKEPK